MKFYDHRTHECIDSLIHREHNRPPGTCWKTRNIFDAERNLARIAIAHGEIAVLERLTRRRCGVCEYAKEKAKGEEKFDGHRARV
jgi:rubredoxin